MTGFDSFEPVPNVKGCWYRIDISECPVCGQGEEHRTRMPPPRPDDPADRIRYEQIYDWCNYG